MSDENNIERGPLDTYEVIWISGHVERIRGHQVLWPLGMDLFGDGAGYRREHVMIHGEFDGHWKLVLSAPVEQISTIRLVTVEESISGTEA